MTGTTPRAAVDPAAIELFRTLQGLSRNRLATTAGISESALWRIETGRQLPRPATAKAIATALGVPLAKLLVEAP